MGDSPRFFSIKRGKITFSDDKGEQAGRIYKGSDGRNFRVHQGAVFNEAGQMILNNVSRVIYLGENLYFLVDARLYRIQEDKPVQATQEKLLKVIVAEDKLTFITTDGQILEYILG